MKSSEIVVKPSKKLNSALKKYLRGRKYGSKNVFHDRYSGLISSYISEDNVAEPLDLEMKLIDLEYQFIKYDGWYESQDDLLQKLRNQDRVNTDRDGVTFFVYPQLVPEEDTYFFAYLQGLSNFWQNLSDLREEHNQSLAVFNIGDTSYDITPKMSSLYKRLESSIAKLKKGYFSHVTDTLSRYNFHHRYESLFGKVVDQISQQARPFNIIKPMIERLSKKNGITSYMAPVGDCFTIDQIIDTNRLRVFNEETFMADELLIDFFSHIEMDRL